MDNNKKIVKALLEKNYVDAKECVFNALYAKASLLLDEERVGIAAELFSEDNEVNEESTAGERNADQWAASEDKKRIDALKKKKRKMQEAAELGEDEDEKSTKTKTATKKIGKAKGPVGAAVESDGY